MNTSTFVKERSYSSFNHNMQQYVDCIIYNTEQHDEEASCFGHVSVMDHHWANRWLHITLDQLEASPTGLERVGQYRQYFTYSRDGSGWSFLEDRQNANVLPSLHNSSIETCLNYYLRAFANYVNGFFRRRCSCHVCSQVEAVTGMDHNGWGEFALVFPYAKDQRTRVRSGAENERAQAAEEAQSCLVFRASIANKQKSRQNRSRAQGLVRSVAQERPRCHLCHLFTRSRKCWPKRSLWYLDLSLSGRRCSMVWTKTQNQFMINAWTTLGMARAS